VIALATIPGVVVGARRFGDGGKWPLWLKLLLAGLVLVNLGNTVELFRTDLAVASARAIDAVGNVVLLSAALSVVVKNNPSDIGGVIDAAIVGLALGGLLWNFVLLPDENRGHVSANTEAATFLVIFALAGALGVVVRLVTTREGKFWPLWLLSISLILALIGNLAFRWVGNSWLRTVAYMMFMAAYTCIGLFGLNRATYRLFRGRAVPREYLSGGRVWFLGAAVALIPVALGIAELTGGHVNGTLLVIGGGLMTALVMIRIRQLSYERERAERALNHLASHDPLTGVLNRREFVASVAVELEQDHSSVILFCDLNGFKPINDRLGHAAGDHLLVEVARRLAISIRQSDTVSRFGGDEFVALLRDAQPADVTGVLSRISAELSRPVGLPTEPVTVGASIGTATSVPGDDAETLIRRADVAMYHAKRAGPTGAPVRIFSERVD
jgi:diguanylate cyclase (GGDEF)-like protein